jgi:hypothetical protein
MMEATFQTTDPGDGGTIVVDRYGQLVELTGVAASETRTLARPLHPGILATIREIVDAGDILVTATGGWNVTGHTVATFGDVGDQLLILSVSTATAGLYRWEILVNTGSVSLA